MIQTLYPPFRHWSETGTIWIYSDPHFSDEDMPPWSKRPSDDEQVASINKFVGRKDTLIILGDIGNLEVAKRLRGHKILICGNHDKGGTIYESIFDEVYTGTLVIAEKIILSHEPVFVPWAFNIHGHDHNGSFIDNLHLNVCSDVIGYKPINFNQWIKSGALAKVPSIHRITIDKQTKRAKERKEKGLPKWERKSQKS